LVNRTCSLWLFCTHMCIVYLPMEERTGAGWRCLFL
jgi:hypothetical protein